MSHVSGVADVRRRAVGQGSRGSLHIRFGAEALFAGWARSPLGREIICIICGNHAGSKAILSAGTAMPKSPSCPALPSSSEKFQHKAKSVALAAKPGICHQNKNRYTA
ncbi:hypothetical protein Y1Q_0005272 [Alligator mississippiensis]|uniref:Uncharacterized protein n=1 Tax=Alligator mississippiensis TaxID=8496 RepID=A0A151MT84_ALLMI|nr:hypothetical protein Y1Q_0005272 [Alligator mississippiensis]